MDKNKLKKFTTRSIVSVALLATMVGMTVLQQVRASESPDSADSAINSKGKIIYEDIVIDADDFKKLSKQGLQQKNKLDDIQQMIGSQDYQFDSNGANTGKTDITNITDALNTVFQYANDGKSSVIGKINKLSTDVKSSLKMPIDVYLDSDASFSDISDAIEDIDNVIKEKGNKPVEIDTKIIDSVLFTSSPVNIQQLYPDTYMYMTENDFQCYSSSMKSTADSRWSVTQVNGSVSATVYAPKCNYNPSTGILSWSSSTSANQSRHTDAKNSEGKYRGTITATAQASGIVCVYKGTLSNPPQK